MTDTATKLLYDTDSYELWCGVRSRSRSGVARHGPP
jgi:hypothetical protein